MEKTVTLMPFQQKTVDKVINEMNNRAIIADEVGLGKTIEAGEILWQKIKDDENANILIVAPKAVLTQWQGEMKHKFGLEFELEENIKNKLFSLTSKVRILVSGSRFSRMKEHDPILRKKWSMLVVDEAHRFSHSTSQMNKNLKKVDKQSIILLTATPLQNNLSEVFELVNLVNPGILGRNIKDFVDVYAIDREARVIKGSMVDVFKNKVKKCIVRTTRKESGVEFAKRNVHSLQLEPTPEEKKIIEGLFDIGRELIKSGELREVLGFSTFSMHLSLSSHPLALRDFLIKKGLDTKYTKINKYVQSIERIEKSTKEIALEELIRKEPNDQFLIFVERLTTGRRLVSNLAEKFGKSNFYHGGLNTLQRKNMIKEFQDNEIKYLICTSAGSEGLNLQNCHNLINYDLHWNPLRIEQRIGRVHRYGQENTVNIFNLSVKGTIEDSIISKIYDKILLFEMSLGDMDAIYSVYSEENDILEEINRIVNTSENFDEVHEKSNYLAGQIIAAKKDSENRKENNHGLLD